MDRYVVFADIVNKINRSNGKVTDFASNTKVTKLTIRAGVL